MREKRIKELESKVERLENAINKVGSFVSTKALRQHKDDALDAIRLHNIKLGKVKGKAELVKEGTYKPSLKEIK